jgi:hypothetical protein
MSMPVSFLPIAPVSPAGAGASGGSDGGAQFGAVLDSLTPRNPRTEKAHREPGERRERRREDDPRSAAEAAEAAGAAGAAVTAAPPAAGSAPAVKPDGDTRPPAPGGTPTVAVTSAALSTVDEAVPAVAPSTVDTTDAPSTMDALASATTGERPAGGEAGPGSGSDPGSGQPHGSAAFAAVAPAGRTDAVAGTAATAQASAAQQAPELPPAAQIAMKLAPLRVGPDGTHQMTIHLNPGELGPISVVAQVRGDELSVQLTGSTEAGREALKEALPELEQQLRGDGFNTLAVNVREAARLDAARPAWAGGPGHSATDNATVGTGTTTAGGKTESQPIGQADQLDGFGHRSPARQDHLHTGMYNAAGQAVTSTGQAAGHQAGQHSAGQQPGNQLNPGNQPGTNQPSHQDQYASAEQQLGDGQRRETDHHGGTERLPGRPESVERGQRFVEHRPTADRVSTRSVDLRV